MDATALSEHAHRGETAWQVFSALLNVALIRVQAELSSGVLEFDTAVRHVGDGPLRPNFV